MADKNIRVRIAGILKRDDKILLIKHRKNNKEYWLLPGGGVDYQETFSEALKREFIEETNLEIEPKEMVFIMESIDPSGDKHIVNVTFLVEQTGGELKVGEEERLGELRFVALDDLESYTVYPNIKYEIVEMFKNSK